MKEENSMKSKMTIFMWHIGKVLTDMMSISGSTNAPIIVETFQEGSKLFDIVGQCVYGNLSYKNIFPFLVKFIKSLDYESDPNFKSVQEYSHDLCQDFLTFLEEKNLK